MEDTESRGEKGREQLADKQQSKSLVASHTLRGNTNTTHSNLFKHYLPSHLQVCIYLTVSWRCVPISLVIASWSPPFLKYHPHKMPASTHRLLCVTPQRVTDLSSALTICTKAFINPETALLISHLAKPSMLRLVPKFGRRIFNVFVYFYISEGWTGRARTAVEICKCASVCLLRLVKFLLRTWGEADGADRFCFSQTSILFAATSASCADRKYLSFYFRENISCYCIFHYSSEDGVCACGCVCGYWQTATLKEKDRKPQIHTQRGSKVKLPLCPDPPTKSFLLPSPYIWRGTSDSPSAAICPFAVPILVWQEDGCNTVIRHEPWNSMEQGEQ